MRDKTNIFYEMYKVIEKLEPVREELSLREYREELITNLPIDEYVEELVRRKQIIRICNGSTCGSCGKCWVIDTMKFSTLLELFFNKSQSYSNQKKDISFRDKVLLHIINKKNINNVYSQETLGFMTFQNGNREYYHELKKDPKSNIVNDKTKELTNECKELHNKFLAEMICILINMVNGYNVWVSDELATKIQNETLPSMFEMVYESGYGLGMEKDTLFYEIVKMWKSFFYMIKEFKVLRKHQYQKLLELIKEIGGFKVGYTLSQDFYNKVMNKETKRVELYELFKILT